MNSYSFNILVNETFKKVNELIKVKGEEYSGTKDRLLNFRRLSRDLGLEMETIWRVYAAKHWDAIGQYVSDLQQERKRNLAEPIESRAIDLIVYLLLFLAMVKERKEVDEFFNVDSDSDSNSNSSSKQK